ncbi:MAG TPA: DoxX family protein [Rhodothermales bacterium]|nr:DoxX family protein [Rhodothermales bacterium]
MLWNGLSRYKDLGMLILRLGVGLGYAFIHGWGKISGGPERWAGIGEAMGTFGITFGYTFWGFMASFAEFVGGLLFAFGLFFRSMCALLAFTMLVATTNHLASGDSWRGAAHALKMMFVFTGMLFIGPGKYSVDAMLVGARRYNR